MTAAEWNAKNRPGKLFFYKTKGILPCVVSTRSRAWDSADGNAVVLLRGRTGGYPVTSLEAFDVGTSRR